MSNKKFTNEEINLLSKNKYVLRVNQNGITYSNEFKIHFIAEYDKGKTTRVGFKVEDGKKVRVAKSTGEVID